MEVERESDKILSLECGRERHGGGTRESVFEVYNVVINGGIRSDLVILVTR